MVAEHLPVDEFDDQPDVVVVANGDPLSAAVVARVPVGAVVVAADGGARLASAAGMRVDHVIGDFDSLADSDRAAAEGAGALLHAYPADKDFTDLELAIELAISLVAPAATGARGRPRIVVLGGAGGRLDHLAANLALLSSPRWREGPAPLDLEWWVGDARLKLAVGGDDPVVAYGPVGSLVSLLAQHGEAVGVATTGLRYPLSGETLLPGSSRGVSNVLAAATATVALDRGVLLVVQPCFFTNHQESP